MENIHFCDVYIYGEYTFLENIHNFKILDAW